MRLDKFLQRTGLVKQRALAKALCQAGKVKVNGKVAKPATDIKVGDIIEGEVGQDSWKVRVLKIPLRAVPAKRRSEFIDLLERHRKEIWKL